MLQRGSTNIYTAFGSNSHQHLEILSYLLESYCESGCEAGMECQSYQAGMAVGRVWSWI